MAGLSVIQESKILQNENTGLHLLNPPKMPCARAVTDEDKDEKFWEL